MKLRLLLKFEMKSGKMREGKIFNICLITICSLMFLSQEITAQETPQDQMVSLPGTTAWWQGFYFKIRLSDRLFYYQENHYRRINSLDDRGDFVGRMGQFYNRPGLVYLVNPSFEITAGPVITFRYTPEPGNDAFDKTVPDLRIWHQYVLNHSIGRIKILHQFRIEHRWLRTNEVGSETLFTNRWRYKISAYIPLNKPRMEDKTWYLLPTNEFFFEHGDHKLELFEENRTYVSLGYTYGNFQFFGGYMFTYGPNQETFGHYRQRHILRLNVMVNLDLRKDKSKPRDAILLPY